MWIIPQFLRKTPKSRNLRYPGRIGTDRWDKVDSLQVKGEKPEGSFHKVYCTKILRGQGMWIM